MRQLIIDGVTVTAPEDMAEEELCAYVDYARQEYKLVKAVDVQPDGDYVGLRIHTPTMPFERIRRITGYLVGALPRWNDAKRAEERDRVKHSLG